LFFLKIFVECDLKIEEVWTEGFNKKYDWW